MTRQIELKVLGSIPRLITGGGGVIIKLLKIKNLLYIAHRKKCGNILLLGYKSEELRPTPLTDQIILTPAGGFLSH